MNEPGATDPARERLWLRPGLVASWPQIIAVLAVVIGYSTAASTWQGLHGSSHRYVNDLLTNARMLHTMVVEGAMLALFFCFLSRRGWTIADFRIKPDGWSTLQGTGLLFAMLAGNFVTVASLFVLIFILWHPGENFARFVIATAPHLKPHSIVVSWAALVPAMVLNACFEEITCMGYAFNQFAAKWGPHVALPVIVLLRMSCHSYQGPVHALGIGVSFFLSGLLYCFTRNLWPLIFAHILLDLFSMGMIKVLFGAP